MSTTVILGKAGRLIVPKRLRDRLNLREGTKLRMEVVGDRLEITHEVGEATIEKRGKRRVVTGWHGFGVVKHLEAMRAERIDPPAHRREE